jgi:hypothetical protein
MFGRPSKLVLLLIYDLADPTQQFSLAMNISEMILYLHRPFFAKILYDRNSDPMRSPFALSYLTVVERCTVSRPSPTEMPALTT